MLLSKVFERFAKGRPVAVIARALMERALEPALLDAVFRGQAQHQYERELLFSTMVSLMALVVCRVVPSVRKAYEAMRGEVPVTLTALYGKLNRVEVSTSEALVAYSGERLRAVLDALGVDGERWLPGHRIKVLDGNHLAATERRIEVLRGCSAGPLPGQSLVILEPETGLATQMVGCEDGHAQERSLLGPVLNAVKKDDIYIADRNFCTLAFLLGIAHRDGFFVVRQHANLPVVSAGTLRSQGRTDTGQLFEQQVTLRLDDKELVIRRIVLRLDTPTRDGDDEMAILTNLSPEVADAATIAGLYRRRWTVESLFARVERNLHSELATLAYPGAALFGFAVALVASNVFAVVQAAMTAAQKNHADPRVAKMPISNFSVVEEIRAAHDGMVVAIDESEWRQFRVMPPAQLAELLVEWAGNCRWEKFRKAIRSKPSVKRPRTRFRDKPHISTARLLGRA